MANGFNLTQQIVQELGASIVTGEYYGDNNSFPVEASLCKQFNVSRSVVREAVKMLTAKGLLSARPRQGTRVEPSENWNVLDPDVLRWLLDRKFSLTLLEEVTDIRFAIEPIAAMRAAERATEESLANIEMGLSRMAAARNGEDDALESDIFFHKAILAASKNRFLSEFEGLIESALKFSIRFTNRFKGVEFASVEDHGKVFSAIKDGNPAGARAAMEDLLTEVRELINSAKVADNS